MLVASCYWPKGIRQIYTAKNKKKLVVHLLYSNGGLRTGFSSSRAEPKAVQSVFECDEPKDFDVKPIERRDLAYEKGIKRFCSKYGIRFGPSPKTNRSSSSLTVKSVQPSLPIHKCTPKENDFFKITP